MDKYCVVLLLLASLSGGFAQKEKGGDGDEPKIHYLHHRTEVRSRFAETLVTSKVSNPSSEGKEVKYVIQLPKDAFITNFTMEIDGELTVGVIKEKAVARANYEEQKALGNTAGLVESIREGNIFEISTHVSANGKAVFNMTYQQVLSRVHGVYKVLSIVDTQQSDPVDELLIEIEIWERAKVTDLHVPQLGHDLADMENKELVKAKSEEDARIFETELDGGVSYRHIEYKPDAAAQRKLADASKSGKVSMQLVALYDVERADDAGTIEVVDGYFVHFFAPSTAEPVPKRILFVLDQSGSMSLGNKMEQTRDAVKVMLDDLNEGDEFSVVAFDHAPIPMADGFFSVNEQTVKIAKSWVSTLVPSGGTNIDAAMKHAIGMCRERAAALSDAGEEDNMQPMIVFMTDGRGGLQPDDLVRNVKAETKDNPIAMHTVAFGSGADFDMLRRIAAVTGGLARKVFEDSDAPLQMRGFYAQISNPLLTKLKIKYVNDTVDPESLIFPDTDTYYGGGEVMVVGKVNKKRSVDSEGLVAAEIDAVGATGDRHFVGWCGTVSPPWPRPPRDAYNYRDTWPERFRTDFYHTDGTAGQYIERMWAYRTIKRLLAQSELTKDNGLDRTELRAEALKLSLKYNFVTELTSLVVAEDIAAEPAEPKAEEIGAFRGASGAAFSRAVGSSGGFGGGGGHIANSGMLAGAPPPMSAMGPQGRPSAGHASMIGVADYDIGPWEPRPRVCPERKGLCVQLQYTDVCYSRQFAPKLSERKDDAPVRCDKTCRRGDMRCAKLLPADPLNNGTAADAGKGVCCPKIDCTNVMVGADTSQFLPAFVYVASEQKCFKMNLRQDAGGNENMFANVDDCSASCKP